MKQATFSTMLKRAIGLRLPLYSIYQETRYSQTSIIRASVIRSFWGQNLVRTTYMKYSQISIICTSIIRGLWDQNLVRPSTVDNTGLTVYCYTEYISNTKLKFRLYYYTKSDYNRTKYNVWSRNFMFMV